jgi:hypothetical protein
VPCPCRLWIWSASCAQGDQSIGGVKKGQLHAAAHVHSSVALLGGVEPCEKQYTYIDVALRLATGGRPRITLRNGCNSKSSLSQAVGSTYVFFQFIRRHANIQHVSTVNSPSAHPFRRKWSHTPRRSSPHRRAGRKDHRAARVAGGLIILVCAKLGNTSTKLLPAIFASQMKRTGHPCHAHCT